MNEVECFMRQYEISDDPHIDTLINDILNAPISLEEVGKCMRNMKQGKSSGIDGIPSECLRHAAGELLHHVTALFNCIFENGDYPESWAEGIINPIHKQGPQNLPQNYRKITVSNAIVKLFDDILNKRLVFYRKINCQEDPFQNGFKERCRTTDNAFILNGIVEKYRSLNKPLFICYVDFKSAFDFINRNALLYKLLKRGVNGKMLHILKSMFEKSKSTAKWNGCLSEAFENLYGVLQGGVTSPTLFNVFLEDLVKYLDTTCGVYMSNLMIAYLLFADDLVLIADSAVGLQKLIDGLQTYCSKWHMLVNLTKTKIMVFNLPRSIPMQYKFLYNGKEIDIVNDYKYVGIFFSSDKNMYKKAREYLAQQANKAIYAVRQLPTGIFSELTPKLKLKIFDTQILPILEYGSEIWSNGRKINILEIVQVKYLKHMLGVKPQTSTLAVYGETGRFPLVLRQQLNQVKYWCRIMGMEQSNPVKCVYDEILKLHLCGFNTWCSHVENTLTRYGLTEIWDAQSITTDKFIPEFKGIIYTNYMNEWRESINDSYANPILRTYKLFKNDFQMEPYLFQCKSLYRRSIAKFRTSSHILRVETGRHQKPKLDINDRICMFCNTNEIDDELHLLTSCPFHVRERAHLLTHLDVCQTNGSSNRLFLEIMQNKNPEFLDHLGQFLCDSFGKRKAAI